MLPIEVKIILSLIVAAINTGIFLKYLPMTRGETEKTLREASLTICVYQILLFFITLIAFFGQ